MPDEKPRAPTGAESRKARLAEELRANLLKRKQQVRSRRASAPDEPEAGSDSAEAGAADDKSEY